MKRAFDVFWFVIKLAFVTIVSFSVHYDDGGCDPCIEPYPLLIDLTP